MPGFGSRETEDRRDLLKLSSEKDWGSKRGASLSRTLTCSKGRRQWARGRAVAGCTCPAHRALTRCPAVRAVPVACARSLQQLQQPLLVAFTVAHGRPRGLSGAQPRHLCASRSWEPMVRRFPGRWRRIQIPEPPGQFGHRPRPRDGRARLQVVGHAPV